MKNIMLFTLLLLISCQDQEPYTQLNTIPYFQEQANPPKTIDLYIMTAHDITGQIYPLIEKKGPLKNQQIFKSGGLSIIKAYYEIAKSRYKDQLILIGNGNPFNFKTKFDRQISLIKEMDFDVLNIIGPEVNTLIEKLPLESLYPLPFFSSNIVDAANGEHFSLSSKSIGSHNIIERNGIKIGVINLSDYKTIPSSLSKDFKGIYYKDIVASTLKEAKALKNKKVNAIIVNVNIKSQCKNKNQLFKSFNKKLKCPSKDPLKKYIERLPSNVIDLIIASGGTKGSGTINGIPVIKEEPKGRFLGIAKLSFTKDEKVLLKDEVSIFPPIKTCHHFYAATNDCFFDIKNKKVNIERKKILEESAYLVIPAMFLGHEVIQNKKIEVMIYKQKTL